MSSKCLPKAAGPERHFHDYENDGGANQQTGLGTSESIRCGYSAARRGTDRTQKTSSVIAFPFFIGVVAGLRAMTPLAAVSWAAYAGALQVQGTALAFLGFAATPYILSLLALSELISDKLPKTPSRKVAVQFGTRVAAGALCGAALGLPDHALVLGVVAGVIGAAAGTLGGAEVRGRLARAFGKDLPAALSEDLVAMGGAVLIVSLFA